MILNMNIKLQGIDEEFLEELDELIEDTRVEYFIINPNSQEEIKKAQQICNNSQRFKYTLPIKFLEQQDINTIALQIDSEEDLKIETDLPFVIKSSNLTENFIETLNEKKIKGIVLNATENETLLDNFLYSISQNSLKKWTQLGIKNIDYNKIALQSDYPDQSYDDFLDVMLKEISDLTFRAEQTIAAGGTRTLLKTFKLL
jgi:hypothetical protein